MSLKQIKPSRRVSHMPTAEAGCWQAHSAIFNRCDYGRGLVELDRALTALELDRADVSKLRRRWNRLALYTWRHPGTEQRVYDSRSQVIRLFCAVARHVQRRTELHAGDVA